MIVVLATYVRLYTYSIPTSGIEDSSVFVKIPEEQTVYQGRLSKTTLSQHHQGELESSLNRFSVHLLRQCCESDIVPVLMNEKRKGKEENEND